MGMIDAKMAKDVLGCDDATLQQHINSGAVKAQRQGGKLLVDQDDIQRLANREDEEGTIVLTGESDNLQIDLGKVVDDSSETIVQSKASPAKDSQQITFGDELEVVSLEDSKTSELAQTKPTTAQGLSFTDSNTAVMTSVEETSIGATTAPIETGPQRSGPGAGLPNAESGRRSVRSSRRVMEAEVQVPWYWMACMALAFAIGALAIAPYYVVATTARPGEVDAGKYALRGADDSLWSGMASGVAGFAVEPDQKKWAKNNPNASEYKDIKAKDGQAVWRFKDYQGGLAQPGERLGSFVIASISADGKQATSKEGGKTYTLVEKKVQSADGGPEIVTLEPQVWAEK